MTERCRITFQVELVEKEKIESIIKKEYPKLKTVSDVVRAALSQFLTA